MSVTSVTVDDYPAWLGTPVTPNAPPQTTRAIKRDLDELVFVSIFDHVLAEIAAGEPLTRVLQQDHRQPDPGRFMRWVLASPARKSRYYEAREAATELIADKIVQIAEGTDSPLEDVTRSTLRVHTHKWLMSRHNTRRYGDTKTIDVNTTVFTPERLKQLSTDDIKRMLLEGQYADADVVDVTDKLEASDE